MLAHVLEIDSTRYIEVLASADEKILAGCVCARCASTWIVLSNSWVERGLQTTEGYCRIPIRLSLCMSCKARERIIPCDVLPGKTNNAQNIFAAAAELLVGASVTDVARTHDVSRAAVRKWAKGLGQRYLDLYALYRHRAMLAALPSAQQQALLVRFWVFVTEATTVMGVPAAITPILPDAKREQQQCLEAFVLVVQTLGGVMQTVALGARLFHQAVLLFRTVSVCTPSSIDFSPRPCNASDGLLPGPRCNEATKSQLQQPADSVVAIREDRAGAGPEPECDRARAHPSTGQRCADGLAIGQEKKDIAGHFVSLDGPVLPRRTASAAAPATQRQRMYSAKTSRAGCARGPPAVDRGPEHDADLYVGGAQCQVFTH